MKTNILTKIDFAGRFSTGLSCINDGALLFFLYMISKIKNENQGGLHRYYFPMIVCYLMVMLEVARITQYNRSFRNNIVLKGI
ncbi:hypothetical protein [Apibacter sp.]|uniref:hypothetical protein n=1 Tax=Apibacter sp. TaxID=2023709 RepID=UPI0025E7B603|nr:hypothetical protein [Apibacter sp.]MCT6870190.1 hypothetical protein [Apibacter sp.]